MASGQVKCAFCGNEFRISATADLSNKATAATSAVAVQPQINRKPMSRRKKMIIAVALATFVLAGWLAIIVLGGKSNYYRSLNDAAWSPDRKTIVSVHGQSFGTTGSLRFWDAESGKLMKVIEKPKIIMWKSLYSPDGKWIAIGEHEAIQIYDTTTLQPTQHFEGMSSFVENLAWSPDSTRLASGDDHGMVRIWDVPSGKLILNQPIHSNNVEELDWSPDGKRIASASWDNSVKIWDAATGNIISSYTDSSYVDDVRWSRDGSKVVSGGLGNKVFLFDAVLNKMLFVMSGHSSSVRAVAWSPDGSRVASAANDDTVRLWNATTGKQLFVFDNRGFGEPNVIFSPDGNFLASGNDGVVRIWNVADGSQRTLRGHQNSTRITVVGWSADSKRLLTIGNYDDTLRMWDVDSSAELYKVEIPFLEGLRHAIF
jgi:WD40 repeat protein